MNSNAHFPELEQVILDFWEQEHIFFKSIEKNEGKDEFVFYDGPPFATGLPHFGHFVPGTVKDIIPRYQTMKGNKVTRRFGWDCHGLPVEYEVEKELGISGKVEIEKYGVDKFNEYCRSIVLRYTSEWQQIIDRLGRWVDFDNDYKTMELDYMESIWWVFKQLWDKGYIYEGHYILPYSPGLTTPLSNFEVNLGGYEQVHDPSLAVKFKVREKENTFFLAWTTTPWTLPSNQGVAVGADIDYVQLLSKEHNQHYILAKERVSHYFEDGTYVEEANFKGRELVGLSYEPIFEYFKDIASIGGFKVHVADFVSTENGTGLVHMAGGFGEDDNEIICKQAGLPIICPVDEECKFTKEVHDYEGIFVKDADKQIIARLKEEGKVLKHEQYLHSYPFCYRTKKPLIYRAVRSWFVDISKIKDKMIAANQEIEWQPAHLKDGRFGKWLESARDWAISRNRYWGNPIPVWINEDGTHVEVIGSIKELEEKAGKKVTDLHKHFVDNLTWEAPDGKGTMRRIPEVLDCWFESGAMPYAQNHYPFENKEFFESHFPADFISEGLDQTRGWFYTLVVLGAALLEKPAFKRVIVNGLVLAEDGKKMSKSEKNYTNPMDVINEFGADALRLFLMNSSVLKAEDLRYSDASVREEMKNFILPLWSAYSFFVTYANIDNIVPKETIDYIPENPLDHWILSELSALVEKVDEQLGANNIILAIKNLYEFLDMLNNWYIRRSRRRFWRSNNDSDKIQGYDTLYQVLITFVKLAAPIIPFITEEIYQNLKTNTMPQSIHLCDFPITDYKRDVVLENKMRIVQRAIALGRGIRNLHQLKNRQPLSAVYFVTKVEEERKSLQEMTSIIQEELNVKEVIFKQNEEDLVSYLVKANYKALGKELGKDMKPVAEVIERFNADQIKALLAGEELTIEVNGREIVCTKEKVVITRSEKNNFKALNEGSLTVALDPELTQELIEEGIIRDIVRNIQNERKNAGLEVTDRIELIFTETPNNITKAIHSFQIYLKNEVLATTVTFEQKDEGHPFSFDINGIIVKGMFLKKEIQ